ncbi:MULTISPECIES: AfsR/SARP family transcriptional regulator [unclassified Nocardiopsis]|uniref:AfsR/SARP family transcriptional regulator n=1 Tax=unclassified Nocardiopsis TaxID=2649073 RepID=UPI001358D555|nr:MULTISPECIES: AfsR/SARP family transcriptional regulator [unclassified Nocardiopsis]
MEFKLLGPLEILDDAGSHVPVNRLKHRQLLVALLLRANTTVSFGQLISDIWGAGSPRSAKGNIKTYVSHLRQLLDRIETVGDGYRIRVEPRELDSAVFDAALRRGLRAAEGGGTDDAEPLLEEALGLWRGSALQDTPLDGDLALTHTHLDEQRLACFEELMKVRLSQGRHTEVLHRLNSVIGAHHPLREQLWVLRMTALSREGRCAEALNAYQDIRSRLVEELGVDPSPALRKLHSRILARSPELCPESGEYPSLRGHRSSTPQQLPIDVPTLYGREEQVELISAHLAAPGSSAPPVVSVEGCPGVGKSALAVHVAHRAAGAFPDGRLYVDLHGAFPGTEPLTAHAVLTRFLRAFGVEGAPADAEEAASRLRTALSGKRVLIVLDDAASAGQVLPLLPSDPACAVLVTARRNLASLRPSLRVRLSVLSPEPAVSMLTRTVGEDRLPPGSPTARALARLAGHLPAALQAVADRLLPHPAGYADHLLARLSDVRCRLDVLRTDGLGIADRIGASLTALHHGGQATAAEAFRRLGGARGAAFTLQEAAELLGVPVESVDRTLEPLLNANLVDSAGPGRYEMHDLVRLYAREQYARRLSVTEGPARSERPLVSGFPAPGHTLRAAGLPLPTHQVC